MISEKAWRRLVRDTIPSEYNAGRRNEFMWKIMRDAKTDRLTNVRIKDCRQTQPEYCRQSGYCSPFSKSLLFTACVNSIETDNDRLLFTSTNRISDRLLFMNSKFFLLFINSNFYMILQVYTDRLTQVNFIYLSYFSRQTWFIFSIKRQTLSNC